MVTHFRPMIIASFLCLGCLGMVEMTMGQDRPATRNVPYAGGRLSRHWLDVYLPPNAAPPYPVALLMHGGGFAFGDKTVLTPFALYLADQGIAAVSINYRLAPATRFPAAVEDTFCALGWIHANADTYGFDPAAVFAAGESAGGYLAAMLGTVADPAAFTRDCPHRLPERPLRGVIPYYPMTGLAREAYQPLAASLFDQFLNIGPDTEDADARYAESSPATYITGTEPPFLIINGARDPLLPVGDAARLDDALRAAGSPVDMLIVNANEHAFMARLDSAAGREAAERAVAFIREQTLRSDSR